MTLPANVRVNTTVPFPALVKGSGPVTIAKVNAIWTLGFDIIDLGTGIPSASNLGNCYLIYYDATLGTFLKVPLSTVPAGRLQRSVATSGDLPVTVNDSILCVDTTAGPLTITLPLSTTRSGAPLTCLDVTGTWATNNVTFNTTSAETINGLARGVLKGTINYSGYTFLPMNDSVHTGWRISG